MYTVSQTAIRLLSRADELRAKTMSEQSETTIATAQHRVGEDCAVNDAISATARDTNDKKSEIDSRCALSEAVALAKKTSSSNGKSADIVLCRSLSVVGTALCVFIIIETSVYIKDNVKVRGEHKH